MESERNGERDGKKEGVDIPLLFCCGIWYLKYIRYPGRCSHRARHFFVFRGRYDGFFEFFFLVYCKAFLLYLLILLFSLSLFFFFGVAWTLDALPIRLYNTALLWIFVLDCVWTVRRAAISSCYNFGRHCHCTTWCPPFSRFLSFIVDASFWWCGMDGEKGGEILFWKIFILVHLIGFWISTLNLVVPLLLLRRAFDWISIMDAVLKYGVYVDEESAATSI